MNGDCIYGKCSHEDKEHEEGMCWHVLDESLEGIATTKKYCVCKAEGVHLRRFGHREMGYAEFEPEDLLITNKCRGCGTAVNLIRDNTLCMFCAEKIEFQQVPVDVRSNIEEFEQTPLWAGLVEAKRKRLHKKNNHLSEMVLRDLKKK